MTWLHNLVKTTMANWGTTGYAAGSSQLDPNHTYTYVPMSKPGDRVWQGAQKDNGVTFLLPAVNFVGQNPYMTRRDQAQRIQRTDGGTLVRNSIGPALLKALQDSYV